MDFSSDKKLFNIPPLPDVIRAEAIAEGEQYLGFDFGALAAAMSLQIAFAVIVSRKMFTSCATLLDPRIVAVVPVAIFMVYYETFWFFHGLFTPFRFKK